MVLVFIITDHALGAGARVSRVVGVGVRQGAGVRGVVVREGQRLARVHLFAEAQQVERRVRADLVLHAYVDNI